ncbi:WD40-repeat-containing domain protein [Thamnidium elegans]|uniref:Mitotic checkpoint protein BUB3 n=1 Tax=Thamnidium elegans TaxID=101142 RepID=A0A8H7SY66_9FUNG|nr:hypothetical protein INT48_001372 [Thamnidium elegans]KAI8070105.1 WD40-repeat-containing domain protein [Thamnidium elegans]
MNDTSQYELRDSPTDGITQICFSPYNKDLLLVSSWDKTLRLYNVESNELLQKIETDAGILACCFGEGDTVYFGGLDSLVHSIDLKTKRRTTLGPHNKPISCICWSPETKRVYSASWDKTLRVWNAQTQTPEIRIDLGQKAFSMDLKDNMLALALGDRKTQIYDIHDMSKPWQERETTLRYMLKCIRLMPNGQGYACSSIEGRVSIEYFDMSSEIQAKKYAFKSHRSTIQDTEVVYPVNSLAFHPGHGTFASGGSDCVVNIWDGVHRKRLRHIAGYPDEISCLAFNNDGSLLAIASSYTFDEGDREHAPDAIFIKRIMDADVAPRITS